MDGLSAAVGRGNRARGGCVVHPAIGCPDPCPLARSSSCCAFPAALHDWPPVRPGAVRPDQSRARPGPRIRVAARARATTTDDRTCWQLLSDWRPMRRRSRSCDVSRSEPFAIHPLLRQPVANLPRPRQSADWLGLAAAEPPRTKRPLAPTTQDRTPMPTPSAARDWRTPLVRGRGSTPVRPASPLVNSRRQRGALRLQVSLTAGMACHERRPVGELVGLMMAGGTRDEQMEERPTSTRSSRIRAVPLTYVHETGRAGSGTAGISAVSAAARPSIRQSGVRAGPTPCLRPAGGPSMRFGERDGLRTCLPPGHGWRSRCMSRQSNTSLLSANCSGGCQGDEEPGGEGLAAADARAPGEIAGCCRSELTLRADLRRVPPTA